MVEGVEDAVDGSPQTFGAEPMCHTQRVKPASLGFLVGMNPSVATMTGTHWFPHEFIRTYLRLLPGGYFKVVSIHGSNRPKLVSPVSGL